MDVLFEIIFELIFELALDVCTNPKLPLPLRIVSFLFYILVVGGVLVGLFTIGISAMKENTILGSMVLLLDAFILGGVIHAIRKRMRR